MNWFVVLLVFSLSLSAKSEEIEVNDGDILELDQRKRSFHSDPDFNRNTDDNQQKLNLKQFLETYAKKHNKNHEEEENLDYLSQENVKKNSKDKSINRWTLLDVQRNDKHPFDERKGWVSLEPIPWSISKISKWQSKYKPSSERPWDVNGPISSPKPYQDDLEFNRPISITPPNPYVYHRPTESSDRYDNFHERPRPTSVYPRPTAFFGNKIHVETHFPSNSFSSTGKPYNYHYQNDRNNHPYDEIITDGQPSNFPTQSNHHYDSFRRKGTEMEISTGTHPFNGEGEWVLLSTTKGYKPQRNHRQRSLQIDSSTSEPSSQILRASRGVRLTVLPPLKGSNVNMTTSHGGLLQVESTFESVEQAKQKFDKKQNKKRKRRKSTKNNGKQQVAPQYGDPEAVVAAVGAGMIPATMAMMVPIAMTG